MPNQVIINTDTDLKKFIYSNYMTQIKNFFGSEQRAMRFLSSMMSSVQRTPELLKCEPMSLINSFMTMAQLGLMPSNVSGEAYVLPYKGVAQFQLGYQGIITLLYGAGNREVIAEAVRENDNFKFNRGKVEHEVDPKKTKAQRGEVIGYYAIIVTATGGTVEGYMTKEDVFAHGAQFSKSFNTAYTPWKEGNDPEGWMPRKTVLKQVAKLAPKNEKLNIAIAADNKDSIIADRLEGAMQDSQLLTMGAAEVKEPGVPNPGTVVPTSGTEDVPVVGTVKVADESTPPMPATPIVTKIKDLPPEDPNESRNKKAMREGMKEVKYEAEKDQV